MPLFKTKRIALPQTQVDMDQLAVDFLQENNFPITPDMLALFGSFVAHSDSTEDTFDPKQVAKMIRKQIANGLVFYLVHPQKRPEAQSTSAEAVAVIVSELPDESKE